MLTALVKKLAPFGAATIEDRSQLSHITSVLEHGKPFNEQVALVPGPPNMCHMNSAIIWATDPTANQLVVGYGLGQMPFVNLDGPGVLPLWVDHSWVLRGNTLIETTFKHEAYFGVVLSATAALRSFYAELKARSPNEEVPDSFLTLYADLRPIAIDAMKEKADEMSPEQLLDWIEVKLTALGHKAAPLREQVGKMRKAGPQKATVLSFLKKTFPGHQWCLGG
ncbi:MAG TPA: hypothetical protein VGL72_10125 [Bryobacteraceae bacterium]